MTARTWTRNTKPEVLCVGNDAPRACRHRHRRYGMTCAEYASLLQRADGRCEICGVPGADTSHGYLVIDHDYAYGFNGGAVRGLLCSPCNTRIAYPTNGAHREAKEQYLANPWHQQKDIIEATGYSRETVRRLIAEGPQTLQGADRMTDFTGVLAVLHTTTPDGRRLAEPGTELTRPMPLPLVRPGESGIGRIDRVWRDGDLIRYSGSLDDTHPSAAETFAAIEEQRLVGMLDADDVEVEDAGGEMVMHGWRVMAATLMPAEGKAWPEVSLTLVRPAGSGESTG